MKRPAVLGVACALAFAVSVGAQQGGSASTRPAPPRDTSARSPESIPPPKGRITGHVVAADSGRSLKRARVFINAAELDGGRGVLTDDSGMFDFAELPA